jgi:membrane associated rhomboid family serine protease
MLVSYVSAMNEMVRPPQEPPGREAALNVPTVIVALLGILVLVQVVRSFLTPEQDLNVLLLFSFLPARYDASVIQDIALPGGAGADVWTFVTYAGLHGGWPHLIFNAIWMLAFGSAVAWRFGPVRFLAFSALCTAAGAALHLAFYWGQVAPVIGASAAIAGHMAAAIRFMVQPGAPLGLFRLGGRSSFQVPAHGFVETLRDRRVALFVIVWFAVNLLSGLGALAVGAGGESIAWQAHIGGFLAGLLLFPVFDPVPKRA